MKLIMLLGSGTRSAESAFPFDQRQGCKLSIDSDFDEKTSPSAIVKCPNARRGSRALGASAPPPHRLRLAEK